MKKTKHSRPRTVVRSAFRGVELPSPCLILVKHGSALANKAMITELVKTMNRIKVHGIVAVVDDFDDLTVLNEEQMNEMGWYLKDDSVQASV